MTKKYQTADAFANTAAVCELMKNSSLWCDLG